MTNIKHKFLYGLSSSAFQTEGDDGTQGRGRSVWDEYCDRENTIFMDQNAKVTSDSYNHLEEDLGLLGELGINAYRFSVSWPRLIPNGTGRLNKKGICFYNRLIDGLLARNIEPCLTLYHWDLPEELSKRGGLKNPDFPKWFEEYTEAIVKNYGDRIKLYIPFNEPINCVHSSYYTGAFAPGERLNKRQTLSVVHNYLLAQGRAADVIHGYRKDNVVTVAMSTFEEYPATETAKCYEAAKRVFFEKENRTDSVDLYLDPAYLGKYPEWVERLYPDFAEKAEKDIKDIYGKLDVIGYNDYGGNPIDENGKEAERPAGTRYSSLGAAIDHNGLYYGVKFLTERYDKPVLITENGYSDDDILTGGKVFDTDRVEYLKKSDEVVKRLVNEGVDLRGYFVWCFTDNFEWLHGLSKRVGVVYTDYETGKRYKKDSFNAYKEIIGNGIK